MKEKEGKPEDAPEKPAAAAPPDPAPSPEPEDGGRDARIEELERENAELRGRKDPPAASEQPAPQVTAAMLRAATPDQRETIEKQFGIPFSDIVRDVEANELRAENANVQARLNVSEIIDEAQASDPKVHNLKIHMKAYLARLPLDVRANQARLREEISHAKTYARGKVAESSTSPAKPKEGKVKIDPNPSPGLGGDEEPEMPEGAVASGTQLVSKDGNFRITVGVGDQLSKEKRKAIQHENDPNGVRFRGEDVPKFAGR